MARRETGSDNASPLTPVMFEILLALSNTERHGYGILQEVERRTNGAMRLRAGTLYRALHRMLASRWVEELDDRPDPELDDERRRYYRLSSRGRAIAAAEGRRLASQVQAARALRLLDEPEKA